MPHTNLCPCNSGTSYAACCEPLLSADRAANTAESLMRSRYTAYTLRDVDYLLRTWHPSTRPLTIEPTTILEWQELHIIRAEKGMESDDEGVVEFIATSLIQKKLWPLHEVSRFIKEGGQWFYVDGDIQEGSPPLEKGGPKVGRNEPCPCGSGKKFKKCCGP